MQHGCFSQVVAKQLGKFVGGNWLVESIAPSLRAILHLQGYELLSRVHALRKLSLQVGNAESQLIHVFKQAAPVEKRAANQPAAPDESPPASRAEQELLQALKKLS